MALDVVFIYIFIMKKIAHFSYILDMGVSGYLWIVVKDVKTLVLYDVLSETAMDSKKGKCASS